MGRKLFYRELLIFYADHDRVAHVKTGPLQPQPVYIQPGHILAGATPTAPRKGSRPELAMQPGPPGRFCTHVDIFWSCHFGNKNIPLRHLLKIFVSKIIHIVTPDSG